MGPNEQIFHSRGADFSQLVVDNSLFLSPQHSDFQPLPALVVPQLPPQKRSSTMPSSGPGTESAVDRKAKPRARQRYSEESQQGPHQLGGVGAKSEPPIAKTSHRIFSPLTDPNTCKRQVFFSLAAHHKWDLQQGGVRDNSPSLTPNRACRLLLLLLSFLCINPHNNTRLPEKP